MSEEHATNNSGAMNGGTANSGLRILVVDDSATIRRSAESMLTTAGYDVVTAERKMVLKHFPRWRNTTPI